jgi:hypothetical protein
MSRIHPRKLLGAFAGSIASLAVRIERDVLRPGGKKLNNLSERLGLLQYRMEYDGSPDDIFIVTYPKAGTTWLQMIVYQLTTDGKMDFTHISEVSPHLEEMMIPQGRRISDLRRTPRVLKTHLNYHDIPKGPGRYIYGTRNGLDVAVSYHHHVRQYVPGWGMCSWGEFFSRFLAGAVPYGSWFEHVAEWLRNKDGLNLLVVSYEELSADLEAGVKRIADFCGITIDPADMPRILERCSFAFMREHNAKLSVGGVSLLKPAIPQKAFIRQGQVGGWRQNLDPRAVSHFQAECDRLLRGLDGDTFRVLAGRGAQEGEPRPEDAPRAPTPPVGDLSRARQPEGALRT